MRYTDMLSVALRPSGRGGLRPDVRRAAGWRISPARRRGASGLAPLYRVGLRRVVFIGVTGSCAKSTTKELIAAVLSSRFSGHKTPGNQNLPGHIAEAIVRVRPWDEFCVVEVAAAIRG